MNELIEEIRILELNEEQLVKLSKDMLLSLNALEMKAIQNYFKQLKRNPTDIELETLAQTWSEHCKHKVMSGSIDYFENGKNEKIKGLFKNFIKKTTDEIGKEVDWLVSVFSDNAGIIKFNDSFDVAFKVETHNHPSALEPYGGANTGIGGVIRDILGVGLGAKPFANTDVFCFGPHDLPFNELPKGILHPKRIAKGVRRGVRDYGNRMGIPTVNGAIVFEERYVGNPLVFCGTAGIIPKGFHLKESKKDDLVVVVGARTGKDGIHGATFSSLELDEESSVSAVQIGNPIEEKKFADVILKARDKRLFNAITDIGGGGFSSAAGEMGEDLGIEIHLDKAPLKYQGLKPWEIWVSESQERMLLAVPEKNLKQLTKMFEDESVEATVIGKFTGKKMLSLLYNNELVGELSMEFLHKGNPLFERKAVWSLPENEEPSFEEPKTLDESLKTLLAMPNIASKESTLRQYDHEVQGGSMLKPLVGINNDGPGDAAIVKPILDAKEAVIISNGINPLYGDIDPYWMAASVIDEAVRNIIAVGGSLERIAILDNFSWGNPNKEDRLGALVRTVKACYDFAKAYGTPFISGKDSFNNEYAVEGKNIAIPGTLLISAISVMKDSNTRVSSDFKQPGNLIYILGETFNELGASHYLLSKKLIGNTVPKVNAVKAKKLFNAVSKVTEKGSSFDSKIIKALHDCSEGGIGVAAAEMAFSGELGAEIDLRKVPLGEKIERNDFILFSESNSRFIAEVDKSRQKEFEELMKGNSFALIGSVNNSKKLLIKAGEKILVNSDVLELKKTWKKTLQW
ncbi:MAG TPA: phosphoribosylformylglycinamidine synthase subunit PurL [archaeon]|nr:phosphoribosylformylglycinamidine synthase subunit PurL [archaeon]